MPAVFLLVIRLSVVKSCSIDTRALVAARSLYTLAPLVLFASFVPSFRFFSLYQAVSFIGDSFRLHQLFPMSGKRRRKDDGTDSDSDSGANPGLSIDMDSNSPAPDSRPHVTSDQTTAPGNDLRPSSDHSRTTDPRLNPTTAPSNEPFLSPTGSYLVVKADDDTVSFRKMNVFWPQKQIAAICGSSDFEIEAPANGTLIIQTKSRKHTKALLNVNTFCGKKVTISLHYGRNSCKGTIFAPELRHMTEDEILSDLRGDGVTHIRRLTTFRDGQRRDTSLLVLTFDTTTLPEKLNIGWLRKDVRVFVPNPLRCYKCQRFGHGSSSCRQSARCQTCGEAPHDGSSCTAPKVCLSCGSSDHPVSSSQCPVWKDEKSICELKAKSGLSYPEARKQVKATKQTPTPGKSYAQATQTQTTSISTQTEPLSVLPPLQLLKPINKQVTQSTNTTNATNTETSISKQSTPVTNTLTTTQFTTPAPVPPQAGHSRQNPGTSCPQATDHADTWKTVKSNRGKQSGAGQTHTQSNKNTPPQSPSRGRSRNKDPEKQSHLLVGVPVSKSHSQPRSRSTGGQPPNGGNSKSS